MRDDLSETSTVVPFPVFISLSACVQVTFGAGVPAIETEIVNEEPGLRICADLYLSSYVIFGAAKTSDVYM